jgi:hypothetical protein
MELVVRFALIMLVFGPLMAIVFSCGALWMRDVPEWSVRMARGTLGMAAAMVGVGAAFFAAMGTGAGRPDVLFAYGVTALLEAALYGIGAWYWIRCVTSDLVRPD